MNREIPKLQDAIQWLKKSNIQNEDGSCHGWYDVDKQDYSFVYPEVTGYAIRLFLQLHQLMGDDRFLKMAVMAGDWLYNIQREDGSIYYKYIGENNSDDRDCVKTIYTFDMAIYLSGLLDLFKATSNISYLRSSQKIANWLLEHQNYDGSFCAGLYSDGSIMDFHHWSRTNSCHQLKIALVLLKFYEILNEGNYLSSTKKLLEWGRKYELDTGRFKLSSECEETYTHAHCYAVEGLLKSSRFFKNENLLNEALRAATWLSQSQNDDGSIWNWYYSKKDRTKVCDATAQSLRIWLILERNHGIMDFSSNISRGFNFLKKMQYLNGDKHSYGGIFYGERDNKEIKHVNMWVTMFTIQALLFREKVDSNSLIDLLF